MTIAGSLRSLANHLLQPLDLTLERRSRALNWQNRYMVRPTLFERALNGKKAPLVLDIGSSVGNTVQHVLNFCPEAQVFAFEPQADLAESSRRRFARNPGVTIYSAGVGAKNGTMNLYVSSRRQSSSLLKLSDFGREAAPFAVEEQLTAVEIVTLDHWYQSLKNPPIAVDLIKLDTQGFESFVIAGGRQVFSKTALVIMEAAFRPLYQKQSVYDEVVPQLKNLGFAIKAVAAGYYNRLSGELIEVDVLFERMKT